MQSKANLIYPPGKIQTPPGRPGNSQRRRRGERTKHREPMSAAFRMIRTFIGLDIKLYGYIQESTFNLMEKKGMSEKDVKEIQEYNIKLIERRTGELLKKNVSLFK